MTGVFVGIDAAIGNTGVVIIGEHGHVISHLNTKLANKIKKAPYYEILRLSDIRESVVGFIREHSSGRIRICMEDYSFNSRNKPFTIGELGGVLRLSIVESFGHIQLVEPTVVKKFAVDHGLATKEKMISQAMAESPEIKGLSKRQLTSDVCDAYFLAKLSWYRYAPDFAVKYETSRDLFRARLTLAQNAPETSKKRSAYAERKRVRQGARTRK